MVNQPERKKRESIDLSASMEWIFRTIQCALAITLVVTVAALIGPELLNTNYHLAQRIGDAALLGLIVTIAGNPVIRYARLLWRDD